MNSPFSEEALDNFRLQGDPLADEVIKTFAAQYGNSVQILTEKLENMIRMPVHSKMCDIIQQQFPDSHTVCNALAKYFKTATQSPGWMDENKFRLGTHVFQDHLFSSVTMLACASLPVCYVCRPDVKVLGFSRRLIDNTPIRLVETAQMLTDVMSNDGIMVKNNVLSGKGIQSVLKIRLIHASIRYLILNKNKLAADSQPDFNNFLKTYISDVVQDDAKWFGDIKPVGWNPEHDGIPINKESTALALLTFSFIILRGLKTLGIKLSTYQQEAYLHSWNVIGHVIGVDESFLTTFNSYENTELIFNQLIQRRRGHTDDGELLQRSLLDVFESTAWALLPLRRLLHARRVARLITSILISPESYKALGLNLSFYDYLVRLFIWSGLRVFAFAVNFRLLRPFADYMFRHLAMTLWDWRKDMAHETQLNGDVAKHSGKHLLIPQELIATSYLSGQFKDKPQN